MRLSVRALALLASATLTFIGACGGAVGGGSTSGEDGTTRRDAAEGRDAQASTPDQGAEAAITYDGVVGDEQASDAGVCMDAQAGQTGTDVCIQPREGPCETACDCCWMAPFGTICLNGSCYQVHGQ